MSRPNKVWFRKDVGWWMVTLGGKKIRLAEGRGNRKLAEQKFYELKAVQARPAERSDARVADVIDRFLSWSKIHRSSETNRNHIYYGEKFAEQIGYLKATELRPHHVTAWVDGHVWGPTTQRNARRSVYRAFAWAVEEGLLSVNPLAGMKCPAARVRQRMMTDVEFRTILKASKRDFKVLLFTLRMTGCRPKEARMLKWEQVRADRWVLAQHKTAHKTAKPRVVYLVKPMRRLMEVLRREAQARPDDQRHVFLNARGRTWTVNAMRLRLARLKWNPKLKLPDDLCVYLARHAFGTAALLNGVDALSVAELLGHSSLEMIKRVYVHLADQHEHLSHAAERATKSLVSAKPPPTEPNQAG